MLDPISDMLTRIRNAQRAGHRDVNIPFSKIKLAIAKILEERKFIGSVKKDEEGKFPVLKIVLSYDLSQRTKKIPAISGIKRISKQGQRVYAKKDSIKKIKNGYGMSIISTSKGIMAGDAAYRKGLGGEVICEVW
jgi:small subunit ribosomal protein S8